jgi:hypothetical protein
MRTRTYLFAVLLFGLQSLCFGVDVPAGIQNDAYDRSLKRYVDGQGLVAYEKWKNSAEDMKALDDYLAQFPASGNAASGNER